MHACICMHSCMLLAPNFIGIGGRASQSNLFFSSSKPRLCPRLLPPLGMPHRRGPHSLRATRPAAARGDPLPRAAAGLCRGCRGPPIRCPGLGSGGFAGPPDPRFRNLPTLYYLSSEDVLEPRGRRTTAPPFFLKIVVEIRQGRGNVGLGWIGRHISNSCRAMPAGRVL